MEDCCKEAITKDEAYEMVEEHNACPRCGERRMNYLQWTDEDYVVCGACDKAYVPAENS